MTNYKNGEAPEDTKVVITDITVYFREKEMQNLRHEVCLKYKGLEYWSNGVLEYWGIKLSEGEENS